MSKTWIDQGEGAFPVPATEENSTHWGMSLRDYFAIRATDADITAHRHLARNISGEALDGMCSCEVARYRFADAMLAARNV